MPEITAPMIHTFSAILLAHVLADFLFQGAWMIRNKRNGLTLLLHGAIVFVVTALALGGAWQAALPVALAHLLIDIVKVLLPEKIRKSFAAFMIDQAAHLVSLAVVAYYLPNAFSNGLLAPFAAEFTTAALFVTGLVVTVQAGCFAVGAVLLPFAPDNFSEKEQRASAAIGKCERLLVFTFVLSGNVAAIGFLLAAKAIYSFAEAVNASQYVILGTFASIAWAFLMSQATRAALEIAAVAP